MVHEIVNFLMQPFWPTINKLVMLVVCTYAVAAGSWRERSVGVTYAAAYLIIESFALVSSRNYTFLGFLADTLCLPTFLGADHKSPHAWTRWALIFQALSVAADGLDLAGGRPYHAASVIALGLLSYGVLGALLTGTMSVRARKNRNRSEGPEL